jgi:hypothetical protein
MMPKHTLDVKGQVTLSSHAHSMHTSPDMRRAFFDNDKKNKRREEKGEKRERVTFPVLSKFLNILSGIPQQLEDQNPEKYVCVYIHQLERERERQCTGGSVGVLRTSWGTPLRRLREDEE